MDEIFYFFLVFYNVLDLNNQKLLWLPSIYQFEKTGTNLNHPNTDFIDLFKELLLRNFTMRSTMTIKWNGKKIAYRKDAKMIL